MTQEKKAKAYDEALDRAKKELQTCGSTDCDAARQIFRFFPELRESEDERIRKELIGYLTHRAEVTGFIDEDKDCKRWIAYLEKQKEQKPIEWKPQPESLEALMYAIEGKWEAISPTSYLSRRLEDLYEGLVNTFNVDESLLAELPKVASRADTAEGIEELRELKHKIEASMEQKPVVTHGETYHVDTLGTQQVIAGKMPQKSAEWSEENEDMLNSCISSIEEAKENRYAYKETDGDTSYDHEIDWLKSLRPVSKESLQPHWKPSEEQMEALNKAIPVCMGVAGRDEIIPLESLYEQLKKL